MLSEVLQSWQSHRPAVAQAMLVQALKALHQVALDKGDWASATLLWPGEDPTVGEHFGGSETEMRHVHSYRKSLSELRGHHNRNPGGAGSSGDHLNQNEENDASEAPRGRGRGRPQRGRGRGPEQGVAPTGAPTQ